MKAKRDEEKTHMTKTAIVTGASGGIGGAIAKRLGAPYLGPYFAAKAGMDALAVAYAKELTRWGIETSIVVPGAFTKRTDHFANASAPDDKATVAEYENGPFQGLPSRSKRHLPRSFPKMPTYRR